MKKPFKLKLYLIDQFIISSILFILSGMLLDGGEVTQIVIVGLLMFWFSALSILAIRTITKVKIRKFEFIIIKFGVLIGVLSSTILNSVLLRLDWEALIRKL